MGTNSLGYRNNHFVKIGNKDKKKRNTKFLHNTLLETSSIKRNNLWCELQKNPTMKKLIKNMKIEYNKL